MGTKTLISLAGAALLFGCGGAPEKPAGQAPSTMPTRPPKAPEVKPDAVKAAAPDMTPKVATAEISPKSGSEVTGTAMFTQTGDEVTVVVQIAGASPGEHGVHVHEKGDCSAPDGKSAGGHFNPTSVDHGAPGATPSHAGDFGNITIGENGTGKLELTTKRITLGEGETSVTGRAIIFHAKKDDFGQPTGNAGPRHGCGVITAQWRAAAATAPRRPTAPPRSPTG